MTWLLRLLGITPAKAALWGFLAVAGVTAITGSYVKGRSDADAWWRAQKLEDQVKAAKAALEISRQSALDASNKLNELATQNADMGSKIDAYEQELAARQNRGCDDFSDAELRRLRSISGGALVGVPAR